MSLRFSSSVAANDRFGICFVHEGWDEKNNDGELIGLETQSIAFTYLLIKAEVKKKQLNVLDIRSNAIIAAHTIDSIVSLDAPQHTRNRQPNTI